jgi:hypothetical protein
MICPRFILLPLAIISLAKGEQPPAPPIFRKLCSLRFARVDLSLSFGS